MTPQIRNYLNEKITWSRTRDLLNPFETTIEGDRLVIYVNDFFDEYRYTLIINDEEYIGFDKWPRGWTAPPPDFVELAMGRVLRIQVKLRQQEEITLEDLELVKRLLQEVPLINEPQPPQNKRKGQSIITTIKDRLNTARKKKRLPE